MDSQLIQTLIVAAVGLIVTIITAFTLVFRAQANATVKKIEADAQTYAQDKDIEKRRQEIEAEQRALEVKEKALFLELAQGLQKRVDALEVDSEQWKNNYLIEVQRNDELEKRVTKAETQLATTVEKLNAAEKRLRELTQERDQLQKLLAQARMELDELKKRLDTQELKPVKEKE